MRPLLLLLTLMLVSCTRQPTNAASEQTRERIMKHREDLVAQSVAKMYEVELLEGELAELTKPKPGSLGLSPDGYRRLNQLRDRIIAAKVENKRLETLIQSDTNDLLALK